MFKIKFDAIKEFIQLETAAGVMLFVAAIIAICLDNSRYSTFYQDLVNLPVVIGFGQLKITNSLFNWVNQGLMTIFFLTVGLEIKREIVCGELDSIKKIALPGFAALGGMLVPALIYLTINFNNLIALKGWAIPSATDIAFALSVLRLLSTRVPFALKVFLSALAIMDDSGAIIIIAIFYTTEFSYLGLAIAACSIVVLIGMNRFGINRLVSYLVVGFILWLSILQSGIHPTLAGVILALTIPINKKSLDQNENLLDSPLYRLEHILHPWVAFLILPIFAFFNAGISFSHLAWQDYFQMIPVGIVLGLFVGKQVGVMSFSWLALKLGLANFPRDISWANLYGVSLLCGVGFTMSLFIADLAFADSNAKIIDLVHLGVLFGSLLSGVAGYMVLRLKNSK